MSILKKQISKGKTTSTTIAICMIVTMAVSMFMVPIPSASAHTPAWQIPTYTFVTALPNPIGVGQTTLIYMWVDKTYDSETLYNNYRFHNYNLTILAPDGSAETHVFETVTDTTSNQGYKFTPNQVGTYTLLFNFPGQNINDYPHSSTSAFVNDTYLSSNATATLIVQQEPILSYPSSYPLPIEYWTRPIYGENPDWWSISSNWRGIGSPVMSSVGTGNMQEMSTGFQDSHTQSYPGDAVGSQTNHVMWTKQLQSGGVVGGNSLTIQGDTWFEGSAYNTRFRNPLIVNGKLYYTEPVSFTGTGSGPTDCVDLRTGQVIWSRNDVPALSFVYIYDVQDPQQHGVFPAILFTSNFARAFDADTGNPMFNVSNVPNAYQALGPQGEHLRYVISNLGNSTNPNYVLAEWNSSKLWRYEYPPYLSPTLNNASNLATWSMTGSTMTSTFTVDGSIFNSTDVNNRYDWNVSIPWRNTMTLTPTVIAAFYNDMLILRNGSLPAFQQQITFSTNAYSYFAVNLNASRPGYNIGDVLWRNNIPAPSRNITISLGGADPIAGVFIEEVKEDISFTGYSMQTGQKLWTTQPQTSLDWYGSTGGGIIVSQVAYGKLYAMGYAGIIYAYDLKTGQLLWTYGNGGEGNTTNSGFEVPGHYPTFVNAVGNDVLYLVSGEHTFQTPIYKGALARAINATDGKEIWTLSAATAEFGTTSYAIADGFSTLLNGYDNRIYTVGRGPSATTVDAPKAAITLGGSLVISGMVTDISSGASQDEQAARFPHGVPVASDASMKDWMGYIYQQKPLPTNFAGVTVVINVVDSNGNYRPIGTATSDSRGAYSLQWTPDIPGKYTVIANFAGTNGYWPSSAETSFAVDAAHPTNAPTQAPSTSAADTYLLPGIIAIIIAIIVVGAILALLVTKKRP